MLGLVDFLTASGITFDRNSTKIHLACWNGVEHPIDVFYAGHFTQWQEHQTRRNFSCANILSLIDLDRSTWLFVGVYEVVSVQPHPKVPDQFLYSLRLLPLQEEIIGRIIVEHQRTRQSYIWLKPEIHLPIVELRRQKMTIGDFPGYNAVAIRHSILRTIIQQKIESWYAALANIKGIYLISDTSSGKLYVGKASGSDGIWQRWCAYADNGHGGNVRLHTLLQDKGPDHCSHFQYSILEIADTHASDADILARESYWMTVLCTRQYGLN